MYYKNVKEQILNVIVNNFDTPLIIFVNDKSGHGLQHLEESDDEEDGKAEMESRDDNNSSLQSKPVVNQKWFESNINDKLEEKKKNFLIVNANLIEQQSLKTNLKEYQFKNLNKIKEI